MKTKTPFLYIIFLILGFIIGLAAHDSILKSNKNRKSFIQVREGQSQLINPLLACDVASEVLSDP